MAQSDGSVRWKVRSDDANSPPTVANGVVYVGSTTSRGNALRVFAAGTGKALGRWQVQGPGGDYSPVTEPMVAHGRVYITTAEKGTAFALPR
jgi:outer membrane protein assembly factor BamB